MKKTTIFILFFIISILYWCWGEKWIEITFEKYSLTIPEWYDEISNPWIIENKQIVNKVITAYKHNTDNWFEKNLIISKTTNTNDLTIEQITDANISKFKSHLAWYEWIWKWQIFIDCSNDVKWIFHKFNLNEDILWNWNKYKYNIQYYFKEWTNLYNISFTTDNNKDIDEFEKYLNTLKCIQ